MLPLEARIDTLAKRGKGKRFQVFLRCIIAVVTFAKFQVNISTVQQDRHSMTSIFEYEGQKEACLDNWKYESGKVMKANFIIGGILFFVDFTVFIASQMQIS
jgi:hypothetical protein